MKKNRKMLLMIMQKYNLNCIEVAKILNMKPTSIRTWRCKNGIDICDNTLELLKLKLEKQNENVKTA